MLKHRDVAKVAAQIRSDIDDVLCIDFVEWNQVDAYSDDLDRVLEAYAADAHDTCRFDDVLELLARMRLNKENRRIVADVVLRVAQAHPKSGLELRSLADKLLLPTSAQIGRRGRTDRNQRGA